MEAFTVNVKEFKKIKSNKETHAYVLQLMANLIDIAWKVYSFEQEHKFNSIKNKQDQSLRAWMFERLKDQMDKKVYSVRLLAMWEIGRRNLCIKIGKSLDKVNKLDNDKKKALKIDLQIKRLDHMLNLFKQMGGVMLAEIPDAV